MRTPATAGPTIARGLLMLVIAAIVTRAAPTTPRMNGSAVTW